MIFQRVALSPSCLSMRLRRDVHELWDFAMTSLVHKTETFKEMFSVSNVEVSCLQQYRYGMLDHMTIACAYVVGYSQDLNYRDSSIVLLKSWLQEDQ